MESARLNLVRVAALIACLGTGARAAGPPISETAKPPLNSISAVLSLTNEEAGQGRPFHLRAQVTLYVHSAYWLFLQDGPIGIYALRPNRELSLKAGDWIEAEGVTLRGGYAPILEPHSVRVVGHSALPELLQVGNLAQKVPEAANVWARVRGRILSSELRSGKGYSSLNFDLGLASAAKMKIFIGLPDGCDRQRLMDATVEIHGVLGTLSGGAQNRQADAMFVKGCEEVEVVVPPAENRSLPLRDISQLLTYRSGTQIDDLVRVSGVVTLLRGPGQFFLQKGRSGILVELINDENMPKAGESIEVIGRLMQDEQGFRRLVGASFLHAAIAEHFEIRHLVSDDFDGPSFAGAMVSAEAKVLTRELAPGRASFSFAFWGWTFAADLPLAKGASTDDLAEVGDKATVTGVARIQFDPDERRYAVTLLVPSPEYLRILAKRPIAERVPWGRVSLAAVALICGAFFWISALQSRVKARTRQLEEANERAERARAAAEQASATKGEFLANMSHEIRTPMNGILGMTEAALETPLNAEQKELIETAQSSAESLLTIINDILDFSKIEAGKLQLDLIPFPLRKMLAKRLKIHCGAAERKGLTLTCVVEESVPEVIVSDAVRLSQVITNLVGNAIKFTDRGQVELKVVVDQLINEGVQLHFYVRDTGIGIPAEKQRSIFEAFSQADASTTRKFGGTGLGLTISTKLAQMLGGSLQVESEEGKGSCFHFTIQAQVVSAKLEPVPAPKTVPQTSNTTVGLLILLAEDNPVNQKVAVRLLQKQGHSVTVAGSGKAAVERWQKRPFDLILMDVQMPDMDGLEATRVIRQIEKTSGGHVPIIALTAHAMAGDRERCLEAGMDGYASKPIRVDELRQEMERLQTRVPRPDPLLHAS